MELLIALIIAHILGDFFLQSSADVADKQSKGIRSAALYKHGLIHCILSFAGLVIVLSDHSLMSLFIVAVVIAICHIVIDLAKCEASSNRVCKQNITGLFLADQIAHLLILAAAANYLIDFSASIFNSITLKQVLVHSCALLLLTKPVSLFIQLIFKDLNIGLTNDSNNDSNNDSHTTEDNNSENDNDSSDVRVGQTIGYIERFIIYFSVFAFQWQAIGFLIAAKSIFRFGDLSDQKHRIKAEMILLGTLLSFGLGILISVLASGLLDLSNK